ncbi:hypothetical protein B484DRAFT_400062, partial [Ochromonadaceae sp. CCMP2298]
MTQLLVCPVRRRPLKDGQWVRFKRGLLKGDLGRVVGVLEGGTRALVQAVPRPDYAASAQSEQQARVLTEAGATAAVVARARAGHKGAGSGAGSDAGAGAGARVSARPPQRLFDAEEARLAGASYVARRSHPLDRSGGAVYDVWVGDYYQYGFLLKEVDIKSTLEGEGVKPRLEELR